MKRHVIAFVVAALAIAPGAHADGAKTEERALDRTRWNGTFRFAGSATEEAARRTAIDKGIETLFFAVRGIARSRLTSGTKIDPWVSFTLDGGKIRVRTPGAPDAASPEDGSAVDYVNDGERTKLTQRLQDGRMVQAFIADEGRRVNAWTLSPDGNTLSVTVTVASPKLSKAVVYTLTYRRSP